MIIDRSVYDIYSAFPQIASFPVYDRPDKRVAVLVRLFSYGDDQDSAKYVRTALWSMRSHTLNSDMRDYQPSVVFHVESAFADTAQPILTAAGVPRENVIVYPAELLKPQRRGHVLHKAVAPLVDPELEQFERVIVFDADSFSLSNQTTGPVPLMDMSLNTMPSDEITLLRGWKTGSPLVDFGNWFYYAGGEKEFYRKAALFCDTTPVMIKRLCFPDAPLETPHPIHNGAYINFATRLVSNNTALREFIHEVSAEMGNEEIAFAVWAMKQYLKTGKYLPSATLEDHVVSHTDFHLFWELDSARASVKKGIAAFLHLYDYHHITNHAYDFAKEVCASDEEAHMFHNVVNADINMLS